MRRTPHTPRFGRRARFALLLGGLLFLLGQFVLNLLVERWRPSLRYPDYGFRLAGLKRLTRAEPGRPVAVLLGTSRTEAGLRPDALPPPATPDGREPLVYNFGIPGFRPLHGLLYLNRLLADGVRPAWVFIEVIPAHLHVEELPVRKPDLEGYDWCDLPIVRSHYPKPASDLYRRWVSQRLWPGYSERLGLLDEFAPRLLPEPFRVVPNRWRSHDRYGWGAWFEEPTPELRRLRVAHAHKEFARMLALSRVSPFTDRVMREALELCRRESIPAALYVMPEGPTFRGWYAPEVRADADAFLARLGRDYGVPVIDARDWMAEDDFIDSHHLLPDGAAAFTRRFGREALAPLLAGGRGG